MGGYGRVAIPVYILPVLFLLSDPSLSQQVAPQSVKFLFYNTENLFDPFDDSLTRDDEFTPGGIRHWTYDRFQDKLLKICKVIVSAGDWFSPPALIGLCEVENAWVLHRLVSETPLVKYDYHFVHYESPDSRGMDVALLYDPRIFRVTGEEPVRITLDNNVVTTRDILYVKGLLWDSITIHLFINHWPSRWMGAGLSEPKRIRAAEILRRHVDSLFSHCRSPLILIAGDFNDDRDDKSLSVHLVVKTDVSRPDDNQLYLLGFRGEDGIYGTARYQSAWYEFDHIIVSGALLHSDLVKVMPAGKFVHHPGFIMDEDESNGGIIPSRTYRGYRYHGGFSDHLPVFINLQRGY